ARAPAPAPAQAPATATRPAAPRARPRPLRPSRSTARGSTTSARPKPARSRSRCSSSPPSARCSCSAPAASQRASASRPTAHRLLGSSLERTAAAPLARLLEILALGEQDLAPVVLALGLPLADGRAVCLRLDGAPEQVRPRVVPATCRDVGQEHKADHRRLPVADRACQLQAPPRRRLGQVEPAELDQDLCARS